MSEADKFGTANSPEITELREQVQSLHSTLSLALVLMFIFTLAVNLYLLHQANLMRGEEKNLQEGLARYHSTQEAPAHDLWLKLSAYSTTHPDYGPVINKYKQFIVVGTNAPVKR